LPSDTPSAATCPRGCIDTDGCGCAWNIARESPAASSDLSPRERTRLLVDLADATKRGNAHMANGLVLRARAAYRTADALRRRLEGR
jgi:hypothetical protein